MSKILEKTILCVDNDTDNCELITFVFEERGYQVISCEGMEEAVRYTRTNSYAAIITDYHLVGTDGTDLCRAVRTFNRITPIVFFTGEARPESKRAAIEAGATAYITKPTNLEQLFETVVRLIDESATIKDAWNYSD